MIQLVVGGETILASSVALNWLLLFARSGRKDK